MDTKTLFSILVAYLFIFTSCKNEYESNNLKIEKISPHVYIHTSFFKTRAHGKMPCNGIVVFDKKEAIIFDTPIDNKSAKELIDWVQNDLKATIKTIIPTHFHVDCLGGLDEFHKHDISSQANSTTIDLLGNKTINRPQNPFTIPKEFSVGKQKVIVAFHGEGHTKDNIVAYIPKDKLLFGGCLVKALNAKKGNLDDSNEDEWSASVLNVKKGYPDAKIVVPGHGDIGGTELLDYTIQLFKK